MKTSFKYILLVAMIVALTEMANAVPTLKIGVAGQTTQNVADGSVGDIAPLAGVVDWSGTIGSWNVVLDMGVVSGSQAFPDLSLTITATSLSASSTPLWLYFSADGFGPTLNGSVSTNIQGTTNGTVNYWSFIAPSNTLFDMAAANLVTSGGPLTGLSFSSSADGGLFSNAGLYSITEVMKITNPGVGQTASSIFQLVDPVDGLNVPDGGTTALLVGLGLLGLSAFSRRRKVTKA